MVQIVTKDRLALCGVQGMPRAAAMRATSKVRDRPPMYITSGCTMSTTCWSIMRCQVGRSQSCSPPVTSRSSACVTWRVCSNSQYGQGSSKWLMPSSCSIWPTAMARAGEKPLLASTSLATPSPNARATTGITSSVRPGHSSTSRPHSAATRHLKASKPCVSRSCTRRAASSWGVMSRFIDEA